jgi:hypothetical protein
VKTKWTEILDFKLFYSIFRAGGKDTLRLRGLFKNERVV